ncbi:hypothetical protein GCM10023075_35330 [Streptosporangium album]
MSGYIIHDHQAQLVRHELLHDVTGDAGAELEEGGDVNRRRQFEGFPLGAFLWARPPGLEGTADVAGLPREVDEPVESDFAAAQGGSHPVIPSPAWHGRGRVRSLQDDLATGLLP